MKQKLLFSTIATAAIFFMNSVLFGQNTEEEIVDFKVFGIGMHIEQFKLADITMDIGTAPANKIIFTITPSRNFRLEPEIGFISVNDKENEMKDKSIQFGIGGFGMYQRGKTNIYAGIKLEFAKISSEYHDYSSGSTETETTNRNSFGPSIGAEYFFGQHFSFGGEIGLKFMNLNTKDSRYTGDNIKQSYVTTDSGLLLRFYF